MLSINKYKKIKTIDTSKSTISLCYLNNEYLIYRLALRGNVSSVVTDYELINDNESQHLSIDQDTGLAILKRLEDGMPFSDAFIFYKGDNNTVDVLNIPSELAHTYTSTGIKFWKHEEQMWNYRNGNPKSIISTHISPEGSCNLNCSYCSVTNRDTHSRIPLDIIKDYVIALKEHGLRAVILTGGGEPTAYKHFNELVRWLFAQNLEIGLVTNGTRKIWKKIDDDVCKMFKWIRVSINIYPGWEENIQIPVERIDNDGYTTIGCSMVYTVEHESINTVNNVALFQRVSALATRNKAQYVRILPNCLLEQENLIRQHRVLDNILKYVKDSRFFHQYKTHNAPVSDVCHQSYFKPYLSEERHSVTGLPGTVYPCDSVVLNDSAQYYSKKYELCHASEISEYLNKNISPAFTPKHDCKGCVHTATVDMLDDWTKGNVDNFGNSAIEVNHQNFI